MHYSDKEKEIMEYLIGSLDDDGLLRKDLDSICDELAIYHNIDVTEKEIEHVLHILQTFDPAGVGGRSLRMSPAASQEIAKRRSPQDDGRSFHRLFRRIHQETLG